MIWKPIALLSPEQIKFCRDLGMKRSRSMNHADTLNSANWMPHRHPSDRHVVGVYGEMGYSIITDQPIDDKTIGRGDKGWDFPDGTNVKSSDLVYQKPNLIISARQFHRIHSPRYCLAWVRLPYVELLGTISRERFMAIKQKVNFGNDLSYKVCWQDLEPFVLPKKQTEFEFQL